MEPIQDAMRGIMARLSSDYPDSGGATVNIWFILILLNDNGLRGRDGVFVNQISYFAAKLRPPRKAGRTR